MKALSFSLFAVIFSISTFALAQSAGGTGGGGDTGSAFVNGDTLYVTVLGDCNNRNGTLNVAPDCHADRETRNGAPICEADLSILQTLRGCPDEKQYPYVLQISLSESRVAPEAQLLKLNMGDTVLDVRIK